MNPRLLRVCLFAAMPAVLSAQEAKLVNCRTLEAAGNFVGPDEVIDGNMVCQKLKPGATAPARTAPAKTELAKSQLEVATPSEQPMSVAEAARANRQRLAARQNAATAPVAAPEKVTPAPATAAAPTSTPVAQPAATVSKPVAAEVVPPPPAAPPPVATAPSQPPQPVGIAPVKPQPIEPVAPPEPAAVPAPVREAAPAVAPSPAQPASAQPVATAASATSAPLARVVRDAPVAAGTPSEPPEKDYGFSDANAAETPAPRGRAQSSAKVPSAAHAQVQVGTFDKPTAATTMAESQAQRTNSAAATQPEGQRPDCTKNITLGIMKEEQFAPGTPSWAQAWIARNQKALPNVCFSETPMRGAKNYLIVFYTMPAGNSIGAMPMPDSSSAAVFTARNGSWSYAGEGGTNRATATPGSVQAPLWYATAYSENGAAVAEQWPEQSKRGDNERVADELLSGMLETLRKQ
jgi:hypothetical protein